MTVKADEKGRVVLPDAQPGDVFDCEQQSNGHFRLVRLTPSHAPKKMMALEVRRAIKTSKLKFDLTWEELRSWTREP